MKLRTLLALLACSLIISAPGCRVATIDPVSCPSELREVGVAPAEMAWTDTAEAPAWTDQADPPLWTNQADATPWTDQPGAAPQWSPASPFNPEPPQDRFAEGMPQWSTLVPEVLWTDEAPVVPWSTEIPDVGWTDAADGFVWSSEMPVVGWTDQADETPWSPDCAR
ncbi:hypothetical protein ABI59_14845 [Acidobacteria bacterium Mor1]|nr:hypothetical protein ABI59_14845 [Acidobacteria bacterium Mor1]